MSDNDQDQDRTVRLCAELVDSASAALAACAVATLPRGIDELSLSVAAAALGLARGVTSAEFVDRAGHVYDTTASMVRHVHETPAIFGGHPEAIA